MNDERLNSRVIYVGTGRQPRSGFLGWFGAYEPERDWRQRLAKEMEDASQEMARRGLRLRQVVPVLSSSPWNWNGSWTEGVWLCFESADWLVTNPMWGQAARQSDGLAGIETPRVRTARRAETPATTSDKNFSERGRSRCQCV